MPERVVPLHASDHGAAARRQPRTIGVEVSTAAQVRPAPCTVMPEWGGRPENVGWCSGRPGPPDGDVDRSPSDGEVVRGARQDEE